MVEAEFFGDGARFHHIGLTVRCIAELHPELESWFDPIQKVRVAFLTVHGAPIELVEPVGPDSPVSRSLQGGQRLLHLCFQVAALHEAESAARAHGFRALGPPDPAVAFGGRRIVWIFSPHYGLVELLESEREPETPR